MAEFRENINTVTVVGFGTMGLGIAQNFAEAGMNVYVVDQQQEALDRGMAQLNANLEVGAEANLISDPAGVFARVKPVLWENIQDILSDTDLAVETVPEILEIKKQVFATLDSLPADILVGSNTSSFTVSQMVADMATPERVVGLHYFNPAHLIPAVEIHHGEKTHASAIDRMVSVMKKVGKAPVRVRKEIPGFIINRLTGAMEREIDHLLDEGVVTPEDLDAAVKASFGFRLACVGPMEAEDLIGLDTAYRVSNNVFKSLSNADCASSELGEKVERGELGVKAGKGWYDYADTTTKEVLARRDRKLMRQLEVYRDNLKQSGE